jgi:hypothetical protein
MYLRHTTRRKDGKVPTYWRLVRSVRIGRRVVQQTVAQLGELDAQGRARAQALAQALVGRVTQPDLFTPETAVEAVVPVHLDRVRLERGRRVGDVWRGWTLWHAFGGRNSLQEPVGAQFIAPHTTRFRSFAGILVKTPPCLQAVTLFHLPLLGFL